MFRVSAAGSFLRGVWALVRPSRRASGTRIAAPLGRTFFAGSDSWFIGRSFWHRIAGHENRASIRHRVSWPLPLAFEYNGVRRAESGGADAARTRVGALATGEMTTSGTQTPPQLPHHKVKIKKTGQRACNEKNEKAKFCGGHLKRWFYSEDVIEQACGDAEKARGPDAEVYRCEHCQTLYLPNPAEAKVNVAGQGMISVFGLTLPPKEK